MRFLGCRRGMTATIDCYSASCLGGAGRIDPPRFLWVGKAASREWLAPLPAGDLQPKIGVAAAERLGVKLDVAYLSGAGATTLGDGSHIRAGRVVGLQQLGNADVAAIVVVGRGIETILVEGNRAVPGVDATL